MPSVTRKLGARVEIDGEKEFKDAIKELNTGSATLRAEMQKLQAEYKGNTESTEYLTKASDLLERELLQQKDKVDKLREAVQRSAEQFGEADARTQKYTQQLYKAEAEQANLQHELDNTNAALEAQGETMTGLGDTVDQLGEKFGIHLPDQLKTP